MNLSALTDSPGGASRPRGVSLDAQQIGAELAEFLKTLKKTTALDASKQIRSFIEKVSSLWDLSVDEHSEMVLDFYQNMTDRINTHSLYRGGYPIIVIHIKGEIILHG